MPLKEFEKKNFNWRKVTTVPERGLLDAFNCLILASNFMKENNLSFPAEHFYFSCLETKLNKYTIKYQ
jgi:hypothetical protein